MRLSIIVPALNEAPTLAACLDALALLRDAGHEVIVVDGGSVDATAAIARRRADRVIVAPRGRARQMNAGAAAAAGDVLLFLHADTHLPVGAAEAVAAAFARGAQWGRFDVTIEGRSRLLPLIAAVMNARSRLTGIATGDQAMFVARDAFVRAGGFPVIALMEDIALSRTLKRVAGAPACLAARVATSGRRWDANGAIRMAVTMGRLRLAYWRGADPDELALRYRHSDTSRAPVLLVFAKEPVPGGVKTRLAAGIGDDAAADVYRELVDRTLTTAVKARDAGIVGPVELWCDPDPVRPVFERWQRQYGVSLCAQRGANLGVRMRGAISRALDGGAPALLVGTDCPGLDVPYLARAAAALADHDVVVGPAEDGGYVLVGMARNVDAFSGMPWSTPQLMTATRRRLAELAVDAYELPTLFDIDTAEDLARYRNDSRAAFSA